MPHRERRGQETREISADSGRSGDGESMRGNVGGGRGYKKRSCSFQDEPAVGNSGGGIYHATVISKTLSVMVCGALGRLGWTWLWLGNDSQYCKITEQCIPSMYAYVLGVKSEIE